MLRLFMLCLCLLASGALAHATKEGTLPLDGATVAAVPVIALDFDQPILITTLVVSGPDGAIATTPDTAKGAKVSYRAIPDAALPAGAYQVRWRGLAEDGHVMQGEFAFTVSAD